MITVFREKSEKKINEDYFNVIHYIVQEREILNKEALLTNIL